MEALIFPDINVDALAKRLKQFYSGEVEAKQAIQKYLRENPRASKAEVFHALSDGKGKGKPMHFSLKGGEIAIHTRGGSSRNRKLRGPFSP